MEKQSVTEKNYIFYIQGVLMGLQYFMTSYKNHLPFLFFKHYLIPGNPKGLKIGRINAFELFGVEKLFGLWFFL